MAPRLHCVADDDAHHGRPRHAAAARSIDIDWQADALTGRRFPDALWEVFRTVARNTREVMGEGCAR